MSTRKYLIIRDAAVVTSDHFMATGLLHASLAAGKIAVLTEDSTSLVKVKKYIYLSASDCMFDLIAGVIPSGSGLFLLSEDAQSDLFGPVRILSSLTSVPFVVVFCSHETLCEALFNIARTSYEYKNNVPAVRQFSAVETEVFFLALNGFDRRTIAELTGKGLKNIYNYHRILSVKLGVRNLSHFIMTVSPVKEDFIDKIRVIFKYRSK
ncbi:helix-turn-helix transcriptional regulator [Enterobacter cloacae]